MYLDPDMYQDDRLQKEFMNKKYLKYGILPSFLALALIGSAGLASAHGMGFFGSQATPQEVATQHAEMFQHQADLLGVSVDEIKAAWVAGKDLRTLAQEKGITDEQIKTKMQELHKQKMKEHLQALVDQGVITQAQADQRAQVMETKLQNGRHDKGFGRHGGPVGF